MAWPIRRKVKRKAPVVKAAGAVPLEVEEQEALLAYLKLLPAPWNDTWFSVPNGERRGFVAQAIAKRLGIRRGVPDVIIPLSSGPYHSLAIEMKRVKGSVTTPEQLWWQERLRAMGWKSEICRGAEAAIKVVEQYRKGK